MSNTQSYYVPEKSKWPILAAIGLFLSVTGAGIMMNDMSLGVQSSLGHYILMAGGLLMAWILFGWFGNVVQESRAGLYNNQMDRSFRWGMIWFIFSEIMFFAAFFGTLFYIRMFTVPWLGGEGIGSTTQQLLWPDFTAQWPLMTTPDNERFPGPTEIIDPFHLPLLNTLILVASSITVTLAHHALRKQNRKMVKTCLIFSLLLAFTFIFFQALEYITAYQDLGLTLQAGIYGATFFILTGFHGAHVILGTIILSVMLIRIYKGHFESNNHFAFEAASWYWHFVDIIWVGLFVLVYII